MFPVVAAITVPAGVSVGSTVNTVAAITGAWEASVGHGRVAGFDIAISTQVQGAVKTPTGKVQRVIYVWLTTYIRTQGHSLRTFWRSGMPGKFIWERNRLVLRQPEDANSEHLVLLDLLFNPKTSRWRGRLENKWFAGRVLLKRPYVPHIGFNIIGDWVHGAMGQGEYSCEHIAMGADSRLVIWSDYIDFPGFARYSNRVTPPPATSSYGTLDMDPEMQSVGGNLMFFTGTDMGGDLVFGHVNKLNNQFIGEAVHFGNGGSNGKFNQITWHRSAHCNPQGDPL